MEMKRLLGVSVALASILASCSSDDLLQPIQEQIEDANINVLRASIENQEKSRAEISDSGIFTWSNDDTDEILVQATDNKFYAWEQNGINEEDGSANFASTDETQEWKGYAVYPSSLNPSVDDDGDLQIELPATYESNKTTPALVGKYDSENKSVVFSHVGGLFRVKLSNVPSTATKFVFSTTDKQICGSFTVEEDANGNNAINTAEPSENTSVTIDITSNDIEDGRIAIDVPLPVGTYTNFTFELFEEDNSEPIFTKTLSGTYNIARRSMLYTAETALIGNTSMSVKGAKSITVNSKTISVRMPYGSDVTTLRTAFSGDATITVNGETVTNNVANIDFSDPVTLAIGDTEYTVTISYSNLPIVYITTPDHVGITSKDDWVEGGTLTIGNTESGENDLTIGSSFKGRGNTTWERPKKPYAIKLDSKSKILGMPKHKRWVLLANYYDRSFMRTIIAFDMGTKSNLAYTPRIKDVELVLNGKYNGLYSLTEQLKIDNYRVNVGDDGFLMEIDARGDVNNGDILFNVDHISNPIVIKDPDVVQDDDNYNFARNFVSEFDSVLFGDNWLDGENGYKKYIDINSFVDWYLINEISKNNDACFFSSCYMNLNRTTGILSMGPLWDYDLAFGNYFDLPEHKNNQTDGFWLKKTIPWYIRMFEDPEFVSLVKERFNYFYSYKDYYTEHIKQKYAELEYSAYGDNLIWNRITTSTDYTIVGQTYWDYCTELDNFMTTRWEWLKSEFDNM
jgi:hypothetical protein